MSKNMQKRIEAIEEHIMANTEYEFVPSEKDVLFIKKAVLAFRKHFPDFDPSRFISSKWSEPGDSEDLDTRWEAWIGDLGLVELEMRLKPEVLEKARTIPGLESIVRMVESAPNRG